MQNKDLVSIVVPVYNVEKYLKECLSSIISQTYKNIEVILVDDGSTDSSGKICDEYSLLYDNFIVIHKKNEGLGMARNTGIEYVNGEYITFLDSDDYLDANTIETMLDTMKNNNVDMCKCGFKRVNDAYEVIGEIKYEYEIFEAENARLKLLPRMIASQPDKKDSIEMAVCGVIYKTALIKQYNIKFPSEKKLISEDLIFNTEYIQYANGAAVIGEMGYNYRMNFNSLTTKYRVNKFDDSKIFYLELEKKLRNLNYDYQTMLRTKRLLFRNIRMSIKQEKKSISHKKFIDRMSSISYFCKDDLLQNVIREYPTNLLGIKERIFLMLIKYKKGMIICILNDLNFV